MLIPWRAEASQRGGGLVEALVAIAIVSIGLAGLFGALAAAMRGNDEARLRSDAAQLAQALIAELWTTAAADLDARFAVGSASLNAWTNLVSSRLPAATASLELAEGGSPASGRSAIVTIAWQRPGTAERHRHVIAAWIGRNS